MAAAANACSFFKFHSNIFEHIGDIFHFHFSSVSDVWSSSGYPSFKNVEILLSGNILIICHCLLFTGYYHRNLELFLELFCLFWHIDINNWNIFQYFYENEGLRWRYYVIVITLSMLWTKLNRLRVPLTELEVYPCNFWWIWPDSEGFSGGFVQWFYALSTCFEYQWWLDKVKDWRSIDFLK